MRTAIEKALSEGGARNNKARAKIMSNVVFSSEFMNGMVRDNLRSLARNELKCIFTTQNVEENGHIIWIIKFEWIRFAS